MQNQSFAIGLTLLALAAACSPAKEPTKANTQPAEGQNSATALSTPVQVRIAPVQGAQLHWQASVPGVIEAFRKAVVAAEVDARVVARSVEPGDPVQAGQPLVVLDDERGHGPANIYQIADAFTTQEAVDGARALMVERGVQRLRMRNEQFSYPIDEARIQDIAGGNISLDVTKAIWGETLAKFID